MNFGAYKSLSFFRRGRILAITLNRPEAPGRVDEFADRLRDGAHQVIRWTKRLVNIGPKQLSSSILDASLPNELLTNCTEDRREAVAAFSDKRKPVLNEVLSEVTSKDASHSAVVPLPDDIQWRTIVEMIRGHASRQPQKLALVACSLDGTVKRLTYEELANRAEDIAAGLRDYGIALGDHVAIALGNNAAYEFVLTEFACARLGAVVVMINPGSKRDELLHALTLTECKAVVAGRETAAEIRALRVQLPVLGPIWEVCRPGEKGALDWESLVTPKRPLE
jgi:non-ribosomal peptide synthetase component F